MGTIVHFKHAGRRLLPFEVQDGERALAEAQDRLTKARLWTAVGHLETALIDADKIRSRLPAGPFKDDFEQKLAALIRHLAHLREQIEQLLPHDGHTVGKPVRSSSGSSSASTKIYDGVDAPPDGIDVPKWRC